jgi:hypothetical protein
MDNQIFISSTCYDLIDLRAELKEFILSLGLKPILSDHSDTEFKSYDTNSIETCLINLRRCKVVIVILSQRYGPSLKDAGFSDHSATHLEYLEAIKGQIKTIVFVRDRLEADFNSYKKAKNPAGLQWIEEKDIHLFDLIRTHKKLTNTDKSNWYWTFRDSLDVKERLKIELSSEIGSVRLHQLIESGKIALLTVTGSGHWITNSNDLRINFEVENVGTQAAIEPVALIFRAENYQQVLEEGLESNIANYQYEPVKSIRPGRSDGFFLIVPVEGERKRQIVNLVLDIVYLNVYGDQISDVSEIQIQLGSFDLIHIHSEYTGKGYRRGEAYHKIVHKN